MAGVLLLAGGVWLVAKVGRARPGPTAAWSSRRAPDDFQDLDPTEFELLVGEAVLRRQGYRDVRHVGGSGDRGVDLRARTARGGLVIVQCKRYAPWRPVREPELRLFLGSCLAEQPAEAVFVTASTFHPEAIAPARRHGVRLIDGALLRRLVAPIPPRRLPLPPRRLASYPDPSGSGRRWRVPRPGRARGWPTAGVG